MKTTMTCTTETLEAFARFAAKEHGNIFSPLDDLTQAEAARIHACSNGSHDAFVLAQVIPEPEPVTVFHYDRENRLERFADGSLYERSSGYSSVWLDAGVFRSERLRDEPLTAGLLEFFGETIDEPTGWMITRRAHEYGPLDTEAFATDCESGKELRFTTREEAEAWIAERENTEYRLAHNESGRPTYIPTPIE